MHKSGYVMGWAEAVPRWKLSGALEAAPIPGSSWVRRVSVVYIPHALSLPRFVSGRGSSHPISPLDSSLPSPFSPELAVFSSSLRRARL